MATFLHFWRLSPAEYESLTPQMRRAMLTWQNRETRKANRAARRR